MTLQNNADGLPAIPPTAEQKYLFDTRGWLLISGVLSETEIAEMRDYCYRLQKDAASLPPSQRSSISGPLEKLIDHPIIVGFMNEFVADPYLESENGYGFRMESSFLTIRSEGHNNWGPHGGGGSLAFGQNSHIYRYFPGKVYSGLTRAVWELNPVKKGDGGTLFLTGSHKAAFDAPDGIQDPHSPLWEDYDCPAGSLLFFTEGVTHSGTRWSNPEVDRVALFQCYNTIGWKWHDWNPHPETLAALPALRRSLFRPVHCDNNKL